MADKKTEKTMVAMTDGRVVGFNKLTKVVRSSVIDEEAGTVVSTFDFRNGETRRFTSNPAILLRLAAYGAESKIGSTSDKTDSIDDCLLAVEDMIARLDKGEWTAPRKAGEFARGFDQSAMQDRSPGKLPGLPRCCPFTLIKPGDHVLDCEKAIVD